MYLLSEKLRKFFMPMVIISLMSLVLFLFYEYAVLYITESYFIINSVFSFSYNAIFLIYVMYPLIKILFKNYGTILQRIIASLLLVSSFLSLYFSLIELISTLTWILYLAVFLNFSSNLWKNDSGYYILSYPMNVAGSNFAKDINSFFFNILMSIVLLIIVVSLNLHYFNLYLVLTVVFAIALVMSSVIYGKTDKSTNY